MEWGVTKYSYKTDRPRRRRHEMSTPPPPSADSFLLPSSREILAKLNCVVGESRSRRRWKPTNMDSEHSSECQEKTADEAGRQWPKAILLLIHSSEISPMAMNRGEGIFFSTVGKISDLRPTRFGISFETHFPSTYEFRLCARYKRHERERWFHGFRLDGGRWRRERASARNEMEAACIHSSNE